MQDVPDDLTSYSIVFVHGLTGKRTKTWLADEAEEPWPKTLLHSDIAEARIMTYGYDADVVNFIKPAGQNTVREHARNFNYDLTNLRRKTSSLSRPLIFVAHSLGGLVCQQACILAYESLEADHQLFDSLVGIMFLGTPHSGSGLAKFALALGFFIKFSMVKTPNNSNLAILKRDSEVLAAVQDSFGTLLQRRTLFGSKALHIHCCIEEKPVPILGAVGLLGRVLTAVRTTCLLIVACRRTRICTIPRLLHVVHHSGRPHGND